MDFDKYKNNLSYPDIPKKPSLLSKTPTKAELATYTFKVEGYEKAKKVAIPLKKAYLEEENRVTSLFKDDAMKEVGLDRDYLTHRKLPPDIGERAYSFAWDLGHSAGMSEVFGYLQDLAHVILGK